MNKSVVAIEGLSHFFGENSLRKQVLFDINLEIHPQEFVILTGPSGSGKSTLLSLVGCLRSVQDGSLSVLGQALKGATKRELTRIRRQFGYITQSSNLLHFLTAQQNVQMSLELHSELTKQQRRDHAKAILESVGLGEHTNYLPDNLSGGQRQRVAIASALVTNPKLILADEPTAALDRKSGRNVVALMHRLAKEHGSAVLMVTHDNRILDLADRIINVEDGKLGLAVSQELSFAFPGFDTSLLENVATQPTVLTYAAGETIVRQGDRANKFYVILEGNIEILSEAPHQQPKLLRQMSRGEYFGEIGLLQGGKRTATVRVAADSEAKVMAIDESLFRAILKDSDLTNIDIAHQLHRRIMTSHLARVLPNLSAARLAQAIAEVNVVHYGPNSVIVQQGELADKFYLIAKGTVAILKTDENGEEVTERILQTGEYFGEREVVSSSPHPNTIRVLPEAVAEVMVVERKSFCSLLLEANATQGEVASVLCNRLLDGVESQRIEHRDTENQEADISAMTGSSHHAAHGGLVGTL